MSAITPNGIDFVSNKQTTLPGSELLVLQGIPTRRLHIGNETERELQDLAGNAMSTTVICKFSTLRRSACLLLRSAWHIVRNIQEAILAIEQKNQAGVATWPLAWTTLICNASVILLLD